MYRITVFLKFSFLAFTLSVLASCKSTEKTSFHVEQSFSDSLSIDNLKGNRVGEFLGSKTYMQWWTEQYSSLQSLQKGKEHITEEITVTTDSLGTTTRNEKRVTTRINDSQSLQTSQDLHLCYQEQIDSLMQCIEFLEAENVRLAHSSANMEQKSQVSSKPGQGLLSRLLSPLFFAILGALLYFAVSFIVKHIKDR